MRTVVVAMAVGLGCVGSPAQAQKKAAPLVKKPAPAAADPKSFEVITPVFHQLVAFAIPPTFDFSPQEQMDGKNYLRETVLRGETPEKWTQMITLSGAKDAVAGGMTAASLIESIGGGFRKDCTDTFAFKDIGTLKISGQPAYLALVSCGKVPDEHGQAGAVHSESALLIAIQGEEDTYSVQWAERGEASVKPLVFDDAKWQARFRTLQPIRVCKRVPGEKAPYASCLK